MIVGIRGAVNAEGGTMVRFLRNFGIGGEDNAEKEKGSTDKAGDNQARTATAEVGADADKKALAG